MKVSNATRAGRVLAAVLAVFMAVTAISVSAFAQSDSNPKWDAFAGYQYLAPGATVPAAGGDPNNPTPYNLPGMARGIGGALTYNLDKHWGIESDFGYSRDTNSASSEWTVGAGPRFIWRTEDVALFLHALGTFNRVTYNSGFNTSNGVGAILGGGMDIPFGKMFSWRVFGADYVWAAHDFSAFASPAFSNLRRTNFEGARLRTGIVISWGGAAPPVPAAACTIQPAEVMVGEPLNATVAATNFNPKHAVTYTWSGTGGTVTGKDTAASIDTTNATPGSYVLTAHVTDAKATKNNNEASCTANYTIKPLPPKNPPTMSMSATPTDLIAGGGVSLTSMCSSPDGVPVSVANWTSTAGTVSGSGSSANLDTAGAPAGSVTVTATCTDSRGLTAQASTQINLRNPPPPAPVIDKALEARLALHSVYFPTNVPPPNNPDAPMVASQRNTLLTLAADFKKYLEAKPDARLTLGGHADIRGSDAYNQALSERRVEKVKRFLVEQGIPAADIDVKAFGKERNLTLEEVKSSVESNSELTTEERARAMARIDVIKLASNRRVDVTLNAGAQSETSVKQFPFNAADAMSLIGGRESERKARKPAPKKMAKKPVKK